MSPKMMFPGAGGFLENIVFGYMGLRYEPSGLSVAPSLPPYNVSELTLRGVAFAGGTVRLTVNSTHLTLSRTSGTQLTVATTTTDVSTSGGSARSVPLAEWPEVTVMPAQAVKLVRAQSLAAVAAYKPTKSDDDPTQPSPTPAWRNSTEGIHAWMPFDDVANHTISEYGGHIDFVWGAAETRIPEWRAANADIVLAKCKYSNSPCLYLCAYLRSLKEAARSDIPYTRDPDPVPHTSHANSTADCRYFRPGCPTALPYVCTLSCCTFRPRASAEVPVQVVAREQAGAGSLSV